MSICFTTSGGGDNFTPLTKDSDDHSHKLSGGRIKSSLSTDEVDRTQNDSAIRERAGLRLLGIELVNATAVRVSWSVGDSTQPTEVEYECIFTSNGQVFTRFHDSVHWGNWSLVIRLCPEDMSTSFQHTVTLTQTSSDSETLTSVKETFSLGLFIVQYSNNIV